MKRLSKAILLITLALSLLLCSCGILEEKEKTFTVEGMSITLTNRFHKTKQEGFTVAFDSSKIAIFALKEVFGDKLNADTTLAEYAELVVSANSLDVEPKEENGLTCFTFENDASGTSYTYLAVVYKADDAFWLLQFATKSSDFDEKKDTLVSYAKTVTFD